MDRTAYAPVHSPSGTWVTISTKWRWTSSAAAFFSAGVLARTYLSRSASIFSSHGQPARALSQVAAR